MTGQRVGPNGLVALRERLGARERGIVEQVAQLRLMSAAQIGSLHFASESPEGEPAASRNRRRTLAWLTDEHLLIRIGRRVGGVRAGSTGFVYALGPVGQRLIGLDGSRRRFREPSATFADHTLAVTQLVVDLTVAERQGLCEVLGVEAEPACWRTVTGMSGRLTLRPDLFVSLGVGDFERRFFVEIDRGTEHLPALLRKCRAYESYYRSGVEQARHGVFPRVAWIIPDEQRATRLREAVARDRQLTQALFVVGLTNSAVATLTETDQ
jgi:hypothetical protein